MIRYSIEKKYTTLVLVVIILVLGYVSYTGLPLDLLPDLELPMLVIMTQDPGQTPEAMEAKITRPLEKLLSSTEGLEELQSISSSGRSLLLLSFVQGHNMDSAMIDVSGKIDFLAELWKNTSRPTILRLNPSMLPVMTAAIYDENISAKELTELYEENLQSKLEGTDGVASVGASGLFREEINVFLSEEKVHKINEEILNKVQSSIEEKEGELEEAKEKIQAGKDQLSSASIPTTSPSLPDDLFESSISLASELAELSLNRASNQVYLSSLEQVLLLLQTPAEDLSQTQALIVQYLKDWPFELSEENIENAILWTEDEIIKASEQEALYQAEEAALQQKLDQVLVSLESMSAAQGQMIAQAGNMLLQAQAAASELTKMEVMLESQAMMLESQKEEALATANISKLLNVDSLSKLLLAQNISFPIGYIKSEDGLIPLTIDNPLTEEELPDLLLTDTGEEAIGKIYLKDISNISNSDNSKDYYAKINGKNAILVNIEKQSQANTSEVSSNLALTIEEMEKTNPGLEISPLMDQGLYIRWVIEAILKNILIGALFAMAVLYLFLRDIRFTLLIALSIPLSIVTSIILMYFSNISLNLISLAGLALGVGMMVDNSIVVIENSHRLSLLGYSPKEAALEGAREMAPAITASTMTTAFVFLPILFTQGMARELFTDMALTIAFSLFASLFVALTVIPAVSSIRPYVKEKKTKESKYYQNTLLWSLKHPYLVVLASLLLLGGSIFALLEKGAIFIPDMDTPQINLTVNPEDASQSTQELYDISDEVFLRLEDLEDLELIGGLSSQNLMGSSSGISFHLVRKDSSRKSSLELEKEITDRLADLPAHIQVQTQNVNIDAMGGGGLSLWVLAQDLEEARAYSEKLLEDMEAIPGLKEAYIDEEETEDEFHLVIDREKAMEKMLTPAEVYMQLENRLSLPKPIFQLDSLPLIVTEEGEERLNLSELLNSKIQNNNGDEIRLSSIGSIEKATSQVTIRRSFQKRYLEIKGDIEPDSNITLVSREIDKLIENRPPPTGVELHFSGERDQIDSAMNDLRKMMIMAFIIIYGIMIIQFQSLLAPFIVMFTIPLAFTGGALALLLFGKPLSIIAMLGFLILSGIIVNNGIVFIDTARRGKGPIDEVLVNTGKVRMRPILMTALTTMLGLSPLAMAVGLGSEALQPIGIVIIGGLIYATLMTLYIIPVLYKLLLGGKYAKDTL